MNHTIGLLFACLVLLMTNVSSFSPIDTRHYNSGRFTSISHPSSHTPNIRLTNTFLSAGPAIADKPVTKEEKKVSKDSEKESKSSNSKGWAVRLFNDPMNKREFVARCLTEVCALSDGAAYQCMMKAHQFGISVIGMYHLEMAELYRDELVEKGLVVDMVPVDDDK